MGHSSARLIASHSCSRPYWIGQKVAGADDSRRGEKHTETGESLGDPCKSGDGSGCVNARSFQLPGSFMVSGEMQGGSSFILWRPEAVSPDSL